jgi:TonB family protein
LSASIQIDAADDSDNTFAIAGTDKAVVGRALLVVDPTYPDAAKAAGKLGKVVVEIEVGPDGIVEKAKVVSGPDALRGEAEAAAKLSRFAPAFENRRAVRTAGTLVYKFVSPEKTEIFIRKMKVVPATEEDKRALRLGEVLHFWLYEAFMGVNPSDAERTANEGRFVRDGKARVRIELKRRSGLVTRALKEAGVEIESEAGNTVRGRVPIKGLGAVVEIGEVRYVSPVY